MMNPLAKWMRFCLLPMIGVVLGHTGTVSAATLTEYSAGHTDIRISYEDDDFELLYFFGEGAVLDGVPQASGFEGHPDDAFVRVGDSTKTTIPGAPFDFSFLGQPGDDLWLLSQNSVPGQPFLGVATHELSSATFSGVTLEMTGFSGPGEFAMWQGFAAPSVYWQTSDGIKTNPNDDTLPVGVFGHDHFNYGFTQEGVYEVQLTATADFVAGGSISDVETFRFLVGSATAIPEPSSLAVLAFGAAGILVRRRRRGKNESLR